MAYSSLSYELAFHLLKFYDRLNPPPATAKVTGDGFIT
jgi:hypothetical protein